jgi:hypothetical protein
VYVNARVRLGVRTCVRGGKCLWGVVSRWVTRDGCELHVWALPSICGGGVKRARGRTSCVSTLSSSSMSGERGAVDAHVEDYTTATIPAPGSVAVSDRAANIQYHRVQESLCEKRFAVVNALRIVCGWRRGP